MGDETLCNRYMDAEQLREHAHKMVDYIADYYRDIESFPVCSEVKPGYLHHLLPRTAPDQPETLEDVLSDVKSKIVPGLMHWQNPNFFGFFPTNSTTAGILGEMLSACFNVVAFDWISSPAATELEMVVLDWLGKLLQLPHEFLFESHLGGGGVIQGSASEAILLVVLAAKTRTISEKKLQSLEEETIVQKLTVYTSDQNHPCLQKACAIVGIPMENFRVLPTYTSEDHALSPTLLTKTLENDVRRGLIPCFLGATMGTTSSCAIDPLPELGDIAKEYGMWFHIDAAYAGNACICPEYRHFLNGVEKSHSLNMSANKWLLTNIDCSILWIKDSGYLASTFSGVPERLASFSPKVDSPQTSAAANQVVDYNASWQVPLGRRFRALKLWLVMRLYGASGLRHHLKTHIANAKQFESLVRADPRFEILAPCRFGLVCFRLKPSEGDADNGWTINSSLLEAVNSQGDMFITHTVLSGIYTLRMSIGGTRTTLANVIAAWKIIQEASKL